MFRNPKIKVQDDSGDRKYFTIIPNYILNHSTAIDQALYLQMKRYAGENGRCFATEQTLCKQLGIGRKSYWKSRDYLLNHGWITELGTTKSKTRPIKTYKVNDIWKENVEYYEKISAERNISSGIDKSQKEHKISLKRDIEEEPILNKNQEEEPSNLKQIAEVIHLFKEINPSFKSWFGNTTQRKACAKLLEVHGFEKVSKAIALLPQTNIVPFITTITTPYMLESKWALWESQIKKKMAERNSKGKSIISST